MLDRTLTAEKYNALPEEIQAHYIKRGGSYTLDLSGVDPELSATQTQLDAERRKNIELGSQVRTLSDEVKTTEEKVRADSTKEIETLKAANEKMTTAQKNAERAKHISAIAAKFKHENLISADLQGRIEVEVVDGEIKTTFKNKDGNPVDFKTLDDEYCKNPAYSDILKTGNTDTSFKAPNTETNTPNQRNVVNKDGALDYSKATPAEIAAHLESTVN